MQEIWKELLNSNGQVFVSNLGNVKTKRIFKKSERWLLLKPSLDKKGYLRVGVWINGKPKSERVHRLVGIAFIPNPKNKPQINHKNGIKTDNRVENLEWCTNKENSRHAIDTGLFKPPVVKGEQHGHTKTTNAKILEIVEKANQGLLLCDIAKKYGLSTTTITDIMRGRVWSHITNIKSGRDRRKVLTRDQILEIVEMRKQGLTVKAISNHFGIGETTVSDICSGKSNWKITGLIKARKQN